MSEKRSPKTYGEFLNALLEQFFEVEIESPKEVDEILREAGFVPDEIAKRGRKATEVALARSPLNWRNRARKEIAEAKEELIREDKKRNLDRSDIISAIQKVMEQLGYSRKSLPVHFRNFDTASDKDLLSLLHELEFLVSKPTSQEND